MNYLLKTIVKIIKSIPKYIGNILVALGQFFYAIAGEGIYVYWFNLLFEFDRFVNAIAFGDPQETISGRLGKHFPGSEFTKFVDWLFSEGHCKSSVVEDEGDDRILD